MQTRYGRRQPITDAHGSFAKVGEGITDFLHAGLSRGDVRYYWVRARDKIGTVVQATDPITHQVATAGV
jgi:hypothetical protein